MARSYRRIALHGPAGLWTDVFVALRRKQNSLLAADDLIARLESDKQLAGAPAVRIRSWALVIAWLAIIGCAVAQVWGTVGVVAWILGSAALFGLFSRHQHAHKRRDQKLWDWWEGR